MTITPAWHEKKGFCGKDGRFEKISNTPGSRDKIVKFTVSAVKFSEQVAKVTGASRETLDGLSSASHHLNDARAVFGVLNAVDGIPAMIAQAKKFSGYLQEYWQGYSLGKDGVKIVFNLKERILGVVVTGLRLGQSILFIIIFGIISPLSFADRHFKIGGSAASIGKQFPLFMLIRDSFTLAGNIGEMIYNHEDWSRHKHVNHSPMEREAYKWEQVKVACGVIKSSCDVSTGILSITKTPGVSKWLTVSLGLVSGLMGLVEVGFSSNPNQVKYSPRVQDNLALN